MTTGSLALIIMGAILAQVIALLLLGFYRRREQYLGLHEKSIQTSRGQMFDDPVSTPSDQEGPRSTWEGYREFVVKRKEYEDESRSICSFYLVPTDGEPLPGFRPGQFLTFKLAIDDPLSGQARDVVRCYSLSDLPRSEYYRVSIKRVASPVHNPELPAGLSSSYFHDHVHEGSSLSVRAPSGHFYLVMDEPLPMVLVGGGIGITPMLSILKTVLEAGMQREIWLYYGVRNGSEQIMKEELQALAGHHKNFHLHICYSAPGDSDREGVDYHHQGHVDMALLRTTLRLERYQFYICGPRAMMESMVPGLEKWGVDAGDIHYESFGPATLTRGRRVVTEHEQQQPVSVTFARSGKSLAWDPGSDSLLEFAEDNGIEIESGCRAGSCGSCSTAVTSGEVDYNLEPDADIEQGQCLLCVSRPKQNLVLDA
ncbi:MAG: 2Fe-2S iron-sulfur cluster-binding protein [Candidatus Sedimenticola sp. 20ELBAFRAG]